MLDPELKAKIEEQNQLGGIDIRKLKKGTRLIVRTRNSEYTLVLSGKPGHLTASGGKHLHEPQPIQFPGSTFGGSCLKTGWIGYGMHMEMYLPDGRVLTTSPVVMAEVIGDGWSYQLEWGRQA